MLRSTKSKITKNEIGENVPNLEITEVVSIHCNIVSNNYQRNLRVIYAFVSNKLFRQLIEFSPQNCIFLKTFLSEFSYIELWFTDQNANPLETEDKINTTLVINWSTKWLLIPRYSVHPRDRIFIKDYGFLSFAMNMGKNVGKI